MNIPDEAVQNLSTEVKRSATSGRLADINYFNGRVCESDKYDGVSFSISGPYVEMRPILEAVRDLDNWRVESMNIIPDIQVPEEEDDYEDEGKFRTGLSMFCAYVGDINDDELFI